MKVRAHDDWRHYVAKEDAGPTGGAGVGSTVGAAAGEGLESLGGVVEEDVAQEFARCLRVGVWGLGLVRSGDTARAGLYLLTADVTV